MNMINKNNRLVNILVAGSFLLLTACSDNDSTSPQPEPDPDPIPTPKVFSVSVTNLTHNQPLSPLALVAHADGVMWTLNEPATVALETMAESGDNSQLLTESYVSSPVSGGEIIPPGNSQTIVMQTSLQGQIYLSLATMLVNTNDAFTGFSQLDVTNLAVGDSLNNRHASYDAGTEGNSEGQGTIPGPADGGEGFNGIRDDVDFVSRHAGIVSLDDGLTTSVLNESHRFDNPVISVSITRTQ